MSDGHERRSGTGVLCALPEELGELAARPARDLVRQGLRLAEVDVDGERIVTAVGGIGKVRAARAATLLLAEGVARLVVVGVCGGLRRSLPVGTPVHCAVAAQADLAARRGREHRADERLRRAWRDLVPGPEGWFLTADRPVLDPWRRLRLARAYAGPCVADMETAAAAAVAVAAGVPWAALRTVTDGAGLLARSRFQREFPRQAPRAADTVPALLRALRAGDGGRALPPDAERR